MSGPSVTIPGLSDFQEIGRGGFAVVYRAHQAAVGRPVAVKVLAALDLDDEQYRRFRQECHAMGALSDHPNIVQVFDAGLTQEGLPFIVMQYMPGGSLWRRVRETARPLVPRAVLDVGVQLAGALHSAHAADILHRDVKPENVLLDATGGFRLADFGIATMNDATRSATGTVTGTIAYLAPELVRGERATARSDVYSLGATLHALASARTPFWRPTDETPVSTIARILHDEPEDLAGLGIVPVEVAQVISRAMAKDPAHRYPTAASLGEALRAVQVQLGFPPTVLQTLTPEAATTDLPTVIHLARPTGTITDPLAATTVRPASTPAPPATPRSGARAAKALAFVAGVVAVGVGVGVVALQVRGDETSAGTTTAPPATVATTAPTTTLAVAAPTATAVALTVPSATAAPTTPPPATPAPSTIPPTTAAPPVNFEPVAVAVAREYADALAGKDWAAARALNPKLGDDAALDKGYRYLYEQEIVDAVTSASNDNETDVRVLVLARENPPAGNQTSYWCFQWRVNSVSRVLSVVGGARLQTYAGELPDGTAPPELVAGCRAMSM